MENTDFFSVLDVCDERAFCTLSWYAVSLLCSFFESALIFVFRQFSLWWRFHCFFVAFKFEYREQKRRKENDFRLPDSFSLHIDSPLYQNEKSWKYGASCYEIKCFSFRVSVAFSFAWIFHWIINFNLITGECMHVYSMYNVNMVMDGKNILC